MLRLLLPLFALIALAIGPGSASAADPPRMTIRSGYDGVAKLGAWFPVEVGVTNTGPEIAGEIQLKVDGLDGRGTFNRPPITYSVPANLPRQSSKRFVLEVFLPAPVEKLSAQLIADGAVLAAAETPFERVGQNETMCGVLSANRSALDFLPAVELPGRAKHIRVAHLDAADLPPTPQLLASLDCLVLSNASLASIGDQQREALRGWTAAGGLLVVAGGPGWQKTLAGLPKDLLPVEVKGTIPLRSAKSLEKFGGAPIEDPGPWLIADARLTDGIMILAEEGVPILVGAQRGRGAVFFLAFDPSLEPLRSWRGSVHLWRYLTAYVPAELQLPSNFVRQYASYGRMPRNTLADLSALRPPTADWMPWLLFGYAVIVGPVTYVALRRFGRLEWSLWTFPIVTLVAAGGAFAFSRSAGEADILFNKVSLIRVWDGQAEGYARTYVSAFSPRENTYEIEIAAADESAGARDNLVWPLFYPFPVPTGTPSPDPVGLSVRRGDVTELRRFTLPARSLGTFQVDSPSAAGLALEANLTSDGMAVHGTIRNRSAAAIRGASLVVGQDVVRLGDLGPGETRQVHVSITAPTTIGYIDTTAIVKQLYPSAHLATPVTSAEVASRDILDNALSTGLNAVSRIETGPVALVGWLDGAPIRLSAQSARSAEINRSLLIASLSVEPSTGDDQKIPPALIERRNLVSGTGRVSGSGMVVTSGELLAFEYRLPHRPDKFMISDVSLDVNGATTSGEAVGDIATASVYDWLAADWRDISFAAGMVSLGDPARVVSALGGVRLRVNHRPATGATTSLTLDRFDLSVSGRGA
ncbi:MAG: hypothetical protein EPO26_06750 [Chloroflexota bacterium]|nr:MAG: hypothetical protein EPO26_06750 [Chloroflexota bacterium]